MRDKIEAFGGRRYLLCWGSLLLSSILQWFGELDVNGTAWGIAVGATVGAYVAGNVFQKKNEGLTNDTK